MERTTQVSDPETEHEQPRAAHIVRKKGLTEAYVMGNAVQALCGVIFVPSRDPEALPVCEGCLKVRAQIAAGREGNN